MRPILIPATAFLAAVLSNPVSTQAQSVLPPPENYKLRVQGFTWGSNVTGEVQKGFGDQPGTLLDLTDDLGIAKKRTYGLDGALQFSSGVKLRGSYTKIDYQGDVNARQTFVFGDKQYSFGERVITTLKGTYYTGALEWDFIKRPQGFLGAFVGAKVLDGDFVLVAPTSGKRDVKSGVAPVPVLGLIARIYSGRRFSVEGELSGLTLGTRGSVWELAISARMHLSDRLAAVGGYRRFKLEARPTDERDFVLVKLTGVVFGVELSL